MICPMCGFEGGDQDYADLEGVDPEMMKKLIGPEMVNRAAQAERVKEIEVIREVPIEVPVEVIKEVVREVEVPVEVVREVEVVKEVPVEVVREVVREVPVEKIVEVQVPGPETKLEVVKYRAPLWAYAAIAVSAVVAVVGWFV